MALSRQEIIDYASRYVEPGAITDFPHDGDLFCLLGRELTEGKPLAEEEGWVFQGYGVCSGYLPDEEAKPAGKWLWMHFLSLGSFPPSPQVLKLQPPHVVKGRFHDPTRTKEFRILKVHFTRSEAPASARSARSANSKDSEAVPVVPPQHAKANKSRRKTSAIMQENVVPFRKKKTSGQELNK